MATLEGDRHHKPLLFEQDIVLVLYHIIPFLTTTELLRSSA
jgi:hypothetical protein